MSPRHLRLISLLPVLAALAGCFVSDDDLYKGVTPLRPFDHDIVLDTVDGGKVQRSHLQETSPGLYRATEDGQDAKGDLMRFFPLPGAPADIMVAESADICPDTAKTCPHVYNVLRLTPAGIESFGADCAKMPKVRSLPGVTAQDDNQVCNFTRRDSLEEALRQAIALPPEATYTFEK